MDNLLDITKDSKLEFNNNEKLIIKTNSNLDIIVNSNVELVLLSNNKIDLNIKLNSFSKLELTVISFNNDLINFNSELLDGSNMESNFIIINKNTTNNITQNVIHSGRDSYSMINNKAIAFNKSTINFTTTGNIERGIKNCNCNQLTRGLILDTNATIKALPILLIDEYDVKAYHGATIGNVNDDDLFYLMSRGLSKNEAFNLVVNGLFKPYFDKVFIEDEYKQIIEEYNVFFK